MKKAINVLIAGCLLGAIVTGPFNISDTGGFSVEAAPSLAFITGVVTDEGGKPLAGAIVAVLEPRPRGKEVKSARTDTQGRFSAGVTPGTYLLRAMAEGFRPQLSSRLNLNRPAKTNYDFRLRSDDTLPQRRGDSDDYRWISRSIDRHIMKVWEGDSEEDPGQPTVGERMRNSFVEKQLSFHGMAQFMAAASDGPAGLPGTEFFVSNFAVSGSLGGNFELAIIGQRGVGESAPERFTTIATTRPGDNHQVTAMISYGRVGLTRKYNRTPLEQLSVSATDSWQVFRPLLVIYGFDYSRFMGDVNNSDSVLPRLMVQYSPTSRLRMNASVTPGGDQRQNSLESFNSENIQASLDAAPPEVAYSDSPIHDRSQRVEVGFERTFGEGNTSIEASGFYDLISGRGVGLMALPLEASLETQATIEQVAHRVAAMDGAARGVRVVFNRRINDHLTASAGYSFGRGSYLNNAPIDSITPARLFRSGFFQVATAKLDLDFTEQTGTRISTVIRLSPSAVIFAIDPFAGRMSVYDPNINIYVTQDLPNFGLPVRWQALVDVRNLLDQINGATGAEENGLQLVSARTRRIVRGGLAFRW
ncbi:MAG TPA: carboxypeptidase-like regulatory domain-containing protein [Blastocatellia bacterium]|nr:carboxypeptidase-like regulatory domain-containing protein [Blastocatellia bacterium]